MGLVYIDSTFQTHFEAYSLTLGGQLALFAPHYRQPFKSDHAFSVASRISQDAWIVPHELFLILDNKKGTWKSVSAVAPCQFLSSCWDILVKDSRYPKIQNDPVVQFLRHVRNAASHGNLFGFSRNVLDDSATKLKKKAEWRGVEIQPDLEGRTLVPDFMEMADPIWLISDISNLLGAVT